MNKKTWTIIVCILCIFATIALTIFAAVKALDEGYTPTEVYNETCIRPTLEYVEAAESEKNAVAEIATTKNEIAAHIPLPTPMIEAIETTVLDNTPTVRYSLTDKERAEIERVVMAECGAEPYDGIIAVAQCILNACEKSGKRPHETIRAYGYTPNRKTPSETVRKAVSEVFDNGKEIVEEYILYFYAPAWGNGTWHETMNFVIEIGGHRFFSDPIITK